MLRLSRTWRVTAALAALAIAQSAVAQRSQGFGAQLELAETRFADDTKNCRPINVADYEALVKEAEQNWAQAIGASSAGLPIDSEQIKADEARAKALLERAKAAAAARPAQPCTPQQQAAQQPPRAQFKTTEASPPTPKPMRGLGSDACSPARMAAYDIRIRWGTDGGMPPRTTAPKPPPESILDDIEEPTKPKPASAPASQGERAPSVPTHEQVDKLATDMETAVQQGHLSEAGYVLDYFDKMAADLRKMIADAKEVGPFSNVDLKAAEERLKQVEDWRKWADTHRVPRCQPLWQEQQPTQPPQTSQNLSPFARDALAAHNDLRAKLGSPPMQWDPVLADHALLRSQELARLGDLVHAPRVGRENERENIVKAPNSYSTAETFGRWTREYADFKPGVFPNICISGGDCGGVLHLTQMGWPTVLRVGCGSTGDGSFTWTVCRYPKGANQDGKEIGTPTAATDGLKAVEAANSWVRARPVGGDYGQAGDARTASSAEDPKGPMPPIKSHPSGAWYVGGDFGAMIVEDVDFDFGLLNTETPALNHDYGYDGGLFVGYDLGAFRIEAEVAYKRADIDSFSTSTNLPPTKPSESAALRFMINSLLDFGDDDGVSGFVGPGLGVARVKYHSTRGWENLWPSGLDDSDVKLIRGILGTIVDPPPAKCPGTPEGCDTKVEPPTLPASETFAPVTPTKPLDVM